jgi:anthranilate synthase component 1
MVANPTGAEFRALFQSARPVPVVDSVLADLDTSLSVFLKLDDGATAFFLESVEGDQRWSRFSVVGLGSRAAFTARGHTITIARNGSTQTIELAADRSVDPLDHLRGLIEELRPVDIEGLPTFAGGAVGYLAYDWVRYVEDLPDDNPNPLQVADAYFSFPEIVAVHDSQNQVLSIVTWAEPAADADAAYSAALERIESVKQRLAAPLPPSMPEAATPVELEITSNFDEEQFRGVVTKCRDYITAGDAFQVVPSQRLSVPLQQDPVAIYRKLRLVNPSPYMFFVRCPGETVIGSSPETLVRLEDREMTLRPLAGTRPRGSSGAEDHAYEEDLLSDPKELAEHVMLVDLARNDLGRVAEIGSVVVDEFQAIERYSHVMHIVSNVRATLAAGKDAIDVLRATFPAGTLTGAPKVRAMEIIDEVEPERRGLYGGAVGYLDYRGNMDMAIAIRTLLVKDGLIHAQAGAGIVADSDPAREYQETLDKARALLKSIEEAPLS